MAGRVASKTFRRVPLDVEQAEFISARIDEYAETHMDELKGDRPKLRKILNWQDEWAQLVAELKAPPDISNRALSEQQSKAPADRPRAADKAKQQEVKPAT